MLSLMFNAVLQVGAQRFLLPIYYYPFIKINEICLLFCLLGINHQTVEQLFLGRIFSLPTTLASATTASKQRWRDPHPVLRLRLKSQPPAPPPMPLNQKPWGETRNPCLPSSSG